MVSLRAIPLVRLMIPLICGILVAEYFPSFPMTWVFILLPIGLVFLFLFSKTKWTYGDINLPFGLSLLVVLFLFGIGLLKQSDETTKSTYFGQNNLENIQQFVGVVTSAPKEGAWWKFTVSVEAMMDTSGKFKSSSGNVMVLMDSSILDKTPLMYGSKILVNGKPQSTENPKNPHQFDYQTYLHHKNIHHQIFIKNEAPIVLSQGEGSWLWARVYPFRKRLLKTLRKHLKSVNTYAVGAAILLGYKDDLSDDVRQTFVETGTMHILAVSGAHVGILYACLAFLLGLLPLYGRKWQIVEPITLVICIWSFVLVTGAAEPAVRAAIMFSFYLFAKILRKDHNIYNILGLSAFLMLLFEPRQLFTIGFQLSFGAVLGIALFWQPFRRLIPWQMNRYAQDILNFVALGCAAQLGILPFSLYYFHQLPTFFWLTGTLVIPFATAYIWGSIALLSLGNIHSLIADSIGWCLDKVLLIMNQMLLFFQKLPGHLIEGVWLNTWMTIVLFIALYALAHAIYSKKKEAIFLMASCMLVISFGNFHHWWVHRKQQKITVYSVGKSLLIDGFMGTSCSTIKENIDMKKELFTAKNNRAANVAWKTTDMDNAKAVFYRPPIFAVGGKKIAIIESDWRFLEKKSKQKIAVDALFFRGKKTLDIAAQMELFNCKTVLVDGSLPYRIRKLCGEKANEYGVQYKNITKHGAWETPL